MMAEHETDNRIVVGYDGYADAQTGLAWAARTAALTGQRVVVVIATARDDLAPRHALFSGKQVEEARASAKRILDDALLTDASVEPHEGPAVPVLVEASRHAGLLVVGSRGYGHVTGVLTGSVSQHVARHAECPVVVARPTNHPASERIVVGVDGSGGSDAAVEFACRRAEVTGESVVLIHGWHDASATGTTRAEVPRRFAERIAEEEATLAAAAEKVRADHPTVRLEAEAIPVAGWRALADASAYAGLVVVGSRGRGAFAGMLLGSVSQQVMQHAQCPVAIVR
jgi:nucleotide-binding universal stress UspA family protein